ncbi:hypothetical protein [Calothrix sp. NIES-2098]|uniref:hypothetical protein n=1 Tax=Calothrix sp. NIES-2098 TaxID=1954171 RepID=UPI000B5FCA86|nr:hypothetical protein NIES2098_01000 [Calothrix sp. NIES-2098]
MYSKHKSSKDSIKLADIRVGSDKGKLRLQFSTRISQKFYSKRQAYKEPGRRDTPENLQWANQIAAQIQADIDRTDGSLFDPTLAKYLEIKPLTTINQFSNPPQPPKLGQLWHEFVDWKLQTKQIQKTTYKKFYCLPSPNYPGLVKKLASKKLEYLKPYSPRHSFISIQAERGVDLKLLANSCGNSVEHIIKHYLNFDNKCKLKDM